MRPSGLQTLKQLLSGPHWASLVTQMVENLAGNVGDLGSSWSGDSWEKGKAMHPQYSCLENTHGTVELGKLQSKSFLKCVLGHGDSEKNQI